MGGALIALAAALAFVASNADHSAPSHTVVVARRVIAPGTQLSSADLEIRSIAISDELVAHGFSDPDELLHAATLAPIGAGELLQRSAVRVSGAPVSGVDFSFPIDREHAIDGELQSGDTVDVLATFGSGLDAQTALLARSVRLTQVTTTDSSSVAGAGRLVVTASFADTDKVLDVAHAAQVAALTLVRTTGSNAPESGRTLVMSPGAIPSGAETTGLPWGLQ
jgi:Flp pilus assembly protein CpaB